MRRLTAIMFSLTLALVPVFSHVPLTQAATSSTCSGLQFATGSIVNVSNASQLSDAISNASSGQTILLADGTYNVGTLNIRTPNLTIRAQSGNSSAVILDANYQASEIFHIQATNTTIANMTIERAYYHPIHVVSGGSNVMLYNLDIIDAGEQFVKVNPDGSGYPDNGTLACSTLELTDAGRTFVQGNPASPTLTCYTGGIDGLQVQGWEVRDNLFKDIYCTNGSLSQHAINFWDTSRDVTVERNIMINDARGIGLGLGSGAGTASTAGVRTYSDLSNLPNLSSIDSFGGMVRNNFVFGNIPQFDTGIGLESAWGASVYHNTIYTSTGLPLDVRFSATNGVVKNNLLSGSISVRDGAIPTLQNNVSNASANLFVDAVHGDLHLLSTATVAINQGVGLGGLVTTDIDNQVRDAQPDVGADELVTVTSNPLVGDLNNDHIVNSLDWSIMNSKWFTTDATADLNHDGLVNSLDWSILNANWFKTN